jgi:formylglycine-generating enzyme required for sulfatase activity
VPLKARRQLPEGETWARELRLAGRPVGEEEAEAIGQRLSEPQSVLELLKAHDGLILLGDPGAGKTTFLKFLALALATGQGKALGLGQWLPILLPLSAYATALEAGEVSLARFIDRYYRERGVELPIDALLEQALEHGTALLLLDGLDEVKDLGRRHLVVDRVADFYSVHRGAGNQFILTSRVVGYPEVRPRLEKVAECTLVDLDEEEIETFVEKWTRALETAAGGETVVAVEEAETEQRELLAAVRRNPGVRALAANPLLLTILALMKRQGVTLPERRVELYDQYVETLLRHWNLARSLAGRGGRELDVVETLRVLAPLALWMHRTSPGVGLVKEGDLHRELEHIYRGRRVEDPERATREFLADVREYSGLLLDRGSRQYGFIHLTFQEYLAAVALAQKGQQGIGPIVEELAAHVDEDTWHEVSLLCVGYLGVVQQRDEAAGAVLEALLEQAPGEPGVAVVLAGEAVNDAGTAGVTPGTQAKVVEALLTTLRDATRIPAVRRAAAGNVLADIGDPRPGVMEVDTMDFCFVPAGPFMMGSDETDDMADNDEKPQAEYTIAYHYWVARYPVTVAQFRAYVEASGVQPGNLDSLRGPSNHPVVWVSWHEAQAFCEWLTTRWREQGRLPESWLVRLPSEPEWEKAARGGLQVPEAPIIGNFIRGSAVPPSVANPYPTRRYPWGNDPDANQANYADTDIDRTSAVGCFPSGASPYGCEDLSGNVWEWTRSLWGTDWSKPDFRYPYDPTDGREDLEAPDDVRRVLRGGAFRYHQYLVRCAVRYHGFNLDYGRGFRVVVSPFL